VLSIKQPAGLIFHGPKQLQVHVQVQKGSTPSAEPLSVPWDDRGEGRLSEEYLLRGCQYIHTVNSTKYRKTWRGKSNHGETKETLALDPESKPADFFENIWQSEQEINDLHRAHIQQGSKGVDLEQLLTAFSPGETVLCKLRCKAIINTPSSLRDLIGECMVVITQLDGETPQLRQRRIYYLQVLCAAVLVSGQAH
jgi:hypothetical protein